MWRPDELAIFMVFKILSEMHEMNCFWFPNTHLVSSTLFLNGKSWNSSIHIHVHLDSLYKYGLHCFISFSCVLKKYKKLNVLQGLSVINLYLVLEYVEKFYEQKPWYLYIYTSSQVSNIENLVLISLGQTT